MSTPIGRKGVARLATGLALLAAFKATGSTSQVIGLDPSMSYDLFFSVAGPSDVTIQVTSDDPNAVTNGTAVYGASKAYATVSAAGYAGVIASGATAIKITHAKNGAGVDDVNIVAALGGRFQARMVPKIGGEAADAAAADQGTYGDYTPLV